MNHALLYSTNNNDLYIFAMQGEAKEAFYRYLDYFYGEEMIFVGWL